MIDINSLSIHIDEAINDLNQIPDQLKKIPEPLFWVANQTNGVRIVSDAVRIGLKGISGN